MKDEGPAILGMGMLLGMLLGGAALTAGGWVTNAEERVELERLRAYKAAECRCVALERDVRMLKSLVVEGPVVGPRVGP